MGKTAIADERLWTYCKQFNPPNGYVFGLILGQPSKTADYVVHMARIPLPEYLLLEHGKKRSEVVGMSLTDFKETWAAMQACDVTRMLPGGMWVLGIFLIGQSDPFENQQNCSRIRTILRHVRTELKKNPYLCGDSPTPEKIVLSMNIQRNLIACRSVDLDSSAFKQMEWKFQKNPFTWIQVESNLDFQFKRHLDRDISSKPLRNQLQLMVETVGDMVNRSHCFLQTEDLDPSDLVETILKKRKNKVGKKGKGGSEEDMKVLTASLFMPMVEKSSVKSPNGIDISESLSTLDFTGGPVSRVFVNQKATISEAHRAVKEDVIRSIAARLEMHADSLVEEEEPPGNWESIHEPPRRVMIKLPSSNVTFSDYLFPGEGPEEALISSEELLDLKLSLEDVETGIEIPAETDSVIEENERLELAQLAPERSSYIALVAFCALIVAISGVLIQIYGVKK